MFPATVAARVLLGADPRRLSLQARGNRIGAMARPADPPSAEGPLQGGCLCGAVRYELTEPMTGAGYCHCTHCQRRTGAGASANGRVPRSGFRLLQGAERLRAYQPPEGIPKIFCSVCGSAVFSGDPESDAEVKIRLGTLDGDPGIRPSFRQFTASAAVWEEIPEDGLQRFPRRRGD